MENHFLKRKFQSEFKSDWENISPSAPANSITGPVGSATTINGVTTVNSPNPTDLIVEIYIVDTLPVIDSNGYYVVCLVTPWSGQGSAAILAGKTLVLMRLDPEGKVLYPGDRVPGFMVGTTASSPTATDDGYALIRAAVKLEDCRCPPPPPPPSYTWTDIKVADYDANVWEAIPVQPSNNGQATPIDATNASPIVVTTFSPHPFATGDAVTISGVTGNTNANGTHTVTKLTSTTFSLDGTTGNGVFGGFASAGANGPNIRLPSWASSPLNSRVLIAVLSDLAPNHFCICSPTPGDKILGTTTWNLTDPGVDYGVYGSWSGQTYEFIRSGSIDVGWTCSNSRNT